MFTLMMARFRKPLAVAVALLFVALSFNAYACLVPIGGASSNGMQSGCADTQEQQSRQICDSFKTLGIQAPPASNLITQFVHVALDSAVVLDSTPLSFQFNFGHNPWQYSAVDSPPRETSSETVVLRI